MQHSQKDWLQFVKTAVDVPISYSQRDLKQFRDIAQKQFPALVRVIEAYIDFHKQTSVTNAIEEPRRARRDLGARVPIFELLRDPRLFPTNAAIANFAQNVLPGMRSYRFDKMSKGDIALRIMQYLETLDDRTRLTLERSMREAVDQAPQHEEERASFVSKWEQIIKGMHVGS